MSSALSDDRLQQLVRRHVSSLCVMQHRHKMLWQYHLHQTLKVLLTDIGHGLKTQIKSIELDKESDTLVDPASP